MKAVFLFGGSGYIARFLLKEFIARQKFDKYFICDIKEPIGFEKEISDGLIKYFKTDVRRKIEIPNLSIDPKNSWVFNLAAIHREPGHERHEYFDTNINGAKNINEFLIQTDIKNLFFTSSIAPYGRSLNQRDEKSELYPETPYGISKGMSELIHENWQLKKQNRRLIIVRPSVIYGPGDPGNVYRMIKAIKKGSFIIPGDGSVIKAYGYVYGLIDSVLFVMDKQQPFILYNYAENPIVNLQEMVRIVKKQFGYNKPVIKVPVNILIILAFCIQLVFKIIGKKSDIHPVRVKKAGFPTNINPNYLISEGFQFNYDFKKSLIHWKSKAPEDFK